MEAGVKPLPLLLAMSIAGCSTPRERDIDRHFRHHVNTANFEDLKRRESRAEAERRCGGPIEPIEGKEGLDPADYRCAAKPRG
jgi:hypothetical protein